MLAVILLTFYLTWNAGFATVTVPVDSVLISGTATLTGTTDKELFSFSIMRSHSECLGVTRVICIHMH